MNLGVMLGTQAATAKECQRETLLLSDAHLGAPSLQGPEAMARFAGAWNVEWEHAGGLGQTIVVEEVFADGFARAILSHGIAQNLATVEPDARTPEFWRVTGRIIDGAVYLQGCQTCAGPYHYCRQVRHAVPSVTKSLGAAVTLLRLA
jgi:hypothetical protein